MQSEPEQVLDRGSFGECIGDEAKLRKQTELKLEINRLIWQYAPAKTTLEEAEDIACKILTMVEGKNYLFGNAR